MFDQSSADDGALRPTGLELELRAALRERSSGVTTASLLRPDPPGQQAFSPRPPVARWRIVGAVAAVSTVILAVVIGRAVMAPQQIRTADPQVEMPTLSAEPWFTASRLTDRLWGATSIVMGQAVGTATVDPTGSRAMTVEFATDGTVVFHDGNNEVRGQFTTDATSVVVTGAGGWVPTSVSRTDTYFEETAALGALLEGMPGPVTISATLIGTELTLKNGQTTITYEMSGVTPAVAAADPNQYLLGAAVGHSWRAVTVGPQESRQPVPSGPDVCVLLGSDGSMSVDEAGALLHARWWATTTGLVTAGVGGTGNSAFDGGTGSSARQVAINAVHEAVWTLTSGFGTFSLSADGSTLTVVPSEAPRVPVTFVRD